MNILPQSSFCFGICPGRQPVVAALVVIDRSWTVRSPDSSLIGTRINSRSRSSRMFFRISLISVVIFCLSSALLTDKQTEDYITRNRKSYLAAPSNLTSFINIVVFIIAITVTIHSTTFIADSYHPYQ